MQKFLELLFAFAKKAASTAVLGEVLQTEQKYATVDELKTALTAPGDATPPGLIQKHHNIGGTIRGLLVHIAEETEGDTVDEYLDNYAEVFGIDLAKLKLKLAEAALA